MDDNKAITVNCVVIRGYSRVRLSWGIPTYIGRCGLASCWAVAVSHVTQWTCLFCRTDTGPRCLHWCRQCEYIVSVLVSSLWALGQCHAITNKSSISATKEQTWI